MKIDSSLIHINSNYDLYQVKTQIYSGLKAVSHFLQIASAGDEIPSITGHAWSQHITTIFEKLFRFVHQGELDDSITTDDVLDAVALCLNARLNIELYSPPECDLPVALEHLVYSASARNKINLALGLPTIDFEIAGGLIDNGDSEDLTFHEIAVLAQMDVQSIRNVATGNTGELMTYQNDDLPRPLRTQVRAADAAQWLKGRKGFVAPKTHPNNVPEGYIEVPVSKDNSIFSHACRQTTGYKIGKKGEERYVETTEEALKALAEMPVAYWRRPNKHGRYGIVRAVEWKIVPMHVFKGQPE